MKRIILVSFVLLMCAALIKPATAAFDGSSPLLCAVVDILECGAGNGCQDSTVEIANIPQFLRIDFENKMVSGTVESGEKREVGIKNSGRAEGKMVLQGGQGGRGWNMVIGEVTGRMSATISGDGFGFVIFGACTTP
jgi:hypothetical protein